MTLAYEQVKKQLDRSYEQGINHALTIAKVVSLKRHATIEAFLLDLSLELAKLKIEMNHTEEEEK